MNYEQLLEEEERYIFKRFSNSDAFVLGSYLSEISIKNNYPVIIQIEKNGQIIYQYANDGTSLNNIYWLEKKANVVKRFARSSAFISAKLEKEQVTFAQRYGEDSSYAATPGAVPIRVKDVGIVGIIGISGLSSEEDHQLIVKGLTYLLESREK